MRFARVLAALFAVLVLALPGCGKSRAAECDSFDEVRQSVNQLTNVTLSENGMSALADGVKNVQAELTQFVADSQARFQAQTDPLKAAVDQLSASVATAKADPNRTTLGAVGTALGSVKAAVQSLGSAVSSSC